MPDPPDIRALLPGSWLLRASNIPKWLGGERFGPRVNFDVAAEEPFVLRYDTSYRDIAGTERHETGTERLRRDGQFVSQGSGRRALSRGRWEVAGAGAEGAIVVVRISRSGGGIAGLDVLVREGADIPEARALIARDARAFGLTAEDFASLAWL